MPREIGDRPRASRPCPAPPLGPAPAPCPRGVDLVAVMGLDRPRHRSSPSSARAASSASWNSRLTPRLMFGAITIGTACAICVDLGALRASWPVVPMTIAQPRSRTDRALTSARPPASVKSIATLGPGQRRSSPPAVMAIAEGRQFRRARRRPVPSDGVARTAAGRRLRAQCPGVAAANQRQSDAPGPCGPMCAQHRARMPP